MIVELFERWRQSEQADLEAVGANQYLVYALFRAVVGLLAAMFLFVFVLGGF